MDYTPLLDYLQARQTAMVEAVEFLVNLESPSTDKLLLDRLALHLQARFVALGAAATVISNPTHGNHVQVILVPDDAAPMARPALLLAHFDTVWAEGTLATRPFHVADGRAWGPGAYDTKGGIVVAEYAFRALTALGWALPRPVILLLNSDEEIGSHSSRALIEGLARQAEYVLVLESAEPGDVLKTARKGVGRFKLEVTGRAAHAGIEPEKGVSATVELAHQILQLHSLNDFTRGTTLNVGIIHGGTRVNIVTDHAEAQIDVRAWTPAEAERITAALQQLSPVLPGAQLKLKGQFNRPPMECTEQSARLFQRAQEIGRELGLNLQAGASGGGSDGNFTAALGVPTLDGLGAVGEGAHAENEQIYVDALPTRAALLAALMLGL